MKLHQLREFVKQVVREEQDYQQLFKHMLDKYGKSITDMSDDEKKKFFNAVDTAYKAKSEGRLKEYKVVKEGYTVRGDNPSQFVQGAYAVLSAYLRDEDLGSKEEKMLKDVISNLEYLAKYFHSKRNESVKEAELTAGQKKIDVDGDGEIEGSDLAKLRANKDESINEEEIKWNAVENAIINFLKMNTKILDKRVKDRDTDGVKGGLQSIIDGLTNAQRSLKLK
jgi:hypothetical protein